MHQQLALQTRCSSILANTIVSSPEHHKYGRINTGPPYLAGSHRCCANQLLPEAYQTRRRMHLLSQHYIFLIVDSLSCQVFDSFLYLMTGRLSLLLAWNEIFPSRPEDMSSGVQCCSSPSLAIVEPLLVAQRFHHNQRPGHDCRQDHHRECLLRVCSPPSRWVERTCS